MNRLFALRIFSKRVPTATPVEPPSTPPGWVWNALDIARRAAKADDLEHIPSIKGIGDIFTQMLEQLQGMKKNRDEFYMITNDIGSLIESIVQYARERKPTSQRFVAVCDDFLNAVSAMQSEMEQIFGSSVERSPKANAYKGILSSYQFRVRCLRSDLQALTPLSSSSGFLSNATGFIISGGELTEVHGNQYIINGHGTTDIQTLLGHPGADTRTTGPMDDLDVSDYSVFKYGDLQAISAPRRRFEERSYIFHRNKQVDVQEHLVRINDQIMTARTYRGKCALQSFKDDVRIILDHKFRHPHIVQLFGVCLSSNVPTLIFYGDLKSLDDDDCFQWNLMEPREFWYWRFRIYGECQVAFTHLMREHRCLHAPDYLTEEGQFIPPFRYGYCIPIRGELDSCSWYLYVDNYQHLQVSIESPLKHSSGPLRGITSWFPFPELSFDEVATIKNALLLHGTIPDLYQIDRKACLLVIYDFLMDTAYPGDLLTRSTAQTILISPTRRTRAARLTFNCEHRFQWEGWQNFELGTPDIDMSYVTIENNSWTRFTIPLQQESSKDHLTVHCRSYFKPPSWYYATWLAQAERITSQIRSSFTSCDEMMLVTGIHCNIRFQSCFTPSSPSQDLGRVFLLVRDLQNVDDAFEIPWFWAKDPEGLERLSQEDALALGLEEPCPLKISFDIAGMTLRRWEELRVFHEVFGFAADSPDIPHFLDLPVASVEWDGGENGPLTPWELFNFRESW